MIQAILKLPRKNKQALMLFFDVLSILSSIFLAFSIRLGYWYFPTDNINLILIIFSSPLIALPIFLRFKLYQHVIRYVNFVAIWSILQAVSLYSLIWTIIAIMVSPSSIPRSVIIMNWLLVMMAISGSRLIARWFLSNINKNLSGKINVLIYGAGSAGRQLSITLNESNEYNSKDGRESKKTNILIQIGE